MLSFRSIGKVSEKLQIVTANDLRVNFLAEAVVEALERGARENDECSPADAVAALCTVLDQTVRAVHPYESPEQHVRNGCELRRVFSEMLIRNGWLLH
jgi:hypothetical protein